jgi:tetratricopeptide (TPR) repeat protein
MFMGSNSSQVSCRACGAGVSPASSICDYCGNPVRITTLKSTVDLSKPLLMKYVKSYENDAEIENSNVSLGLIFLQLGQFDKANQRFDAAINDDPVNAEAYFYKAVADLEGKKPFVCSRKVINEVISQLDAARELDSQPLYTYFSAIVKYDYFVRKKIKITPDYKDDLNDARESGVALGDIDALLTVIRVDLPDVLKI